jgi:hypothetical protein
VELKQIEAVAWSHTHGAQRNPDMPSDQQTSILVDIAGNGGASIASQKLPDLMDLVAAGYVEADEDLYKLTTAGQDNLAERGVGANES